VSGRIRRVEAIQLGQDDGLDHGEALARAVAQIHAGLFAAETVKQLPGRIAQPEKRFAVFSDQITPARVNF